jgi:hypothetical protein
MFKEKTVFVLGAGSSYDFGMPLGKDLKKIIAEKLNFERFEFNNPVGSNSDKVILEALRKEKYSGSAKTTGQFLKAIDTFDTIDEFLASNPEDKEFQLCGKLGIVKSILDAEADSSLAIKEAGEESDYSFFKDGQTGTYLGPLIKQIKREVTVNDFDKLFQKVSFINFNYDRCLERGLLLGLAQSFPFDSVPEGEFNQWVKSAKIIRPFGSVGSYWSGEKNHVPFGGYKYMNVSEKAEKLLELVKGIKTFSENDSEINSIDLIQKEMYSAHNIVFLGFHFHAPNLNLLSPGPHFDNPHSVPREQQILATVLNRSDKDQERLIELFKYFAHRKNPNKIILEDGTCYDLFNNNQLAF